MWISKEDVTDSNGGKKRVIEKRDEFEGAKEDSRREKKLEEEEEERGDGCGCEEREVHETWIKDERERKWSEEGDKRENEKQKQW